MRVFPTMAENSRMLRVLVVEDELLIRWSIAETLARGGHTVIEAEDGATAILALKKGGKPSMPSCWITGCPIPMI